MLQAGFRGLDCGLNKFEPSRGNRLSTVVVWWIRRDIYRASCKLGKAVHVPVSEVHRTNKVSLITTGLHCCLLSVCLCVHTGCGPALLHAWCCKPTPQPFFPDRRYPRYSFLTECLATPQVNSVMRANGEHTGASDIASIAEATGYSKKSIKGLMTNVMRQTECSMDASLELHGQGGNSPPPPPPFPGRCQLCLPSYHCSDPHAQLTVPQFSPPCSLVLRSAAIPLT